MKQQKINLSESEVHIILLWNSALYKKDSIIDDVKSKYKIIEVVEVEWGDDMFAKNMARFYGVKLPDIEGKVSHCGKGKFLLIVLKDNNPKYDFCVTSRGTEYVNKNIFSLKEKYRKWTGGGHRIHTTNNIKETDHNLSLLLGINYSDYLDKFYNKENDCRAISRDLSGSMGWRSLEELFYVLNSCLNYVTLRNFEDLPHNYNSAIHGDIDLLVEDFQEALLILNAQKVFDDKNRVHCFTKVNSENILFDFRFVGDQYYCFLWQRDFLRTRILNDNNIYIPSHQNHFYGVLYHVLIHKREIHKKNFQPLMDSYFKMHGYEINKLDFDDLLIELMKFLKSKNYNITIPIDSSVFYDSRFESKNLDEAIRVLSKQLICEIKPFRVDIWKNFSGYVYFQGKDQYGNRLFIKYSGIAESAQREFEVVKFLENSLHFPNVYYFRNQGNEKFVALEMLDGVPLDKINYSKESQDFKYKILKDLVVILKTLLSNKIVHRDIRPSNLMLCERGVVLIDFQFAVGSGFKEISAVRKDPTIVKDLGEKYRFSDYRWDDAFSIYKVALYVDKDFDINYPQLSEAIRSEIGTLVYRGKYKIKCRLKKMRRKVKSVIKRAIKI